MLTPLFSRVKKIKCVQQPASGKCEACLTANLPCLYRDREQYFAERTRMLSGAGSALRDASSSASSKGRLSAINVPTPTPSRGPTPPQAGSSSGRSSTSSDRSDSPSYFSYMGAGPVDIGSFQPYSNRVDASSGFPAWYVSTACFIYSGSLKSMAGTRLCPRCRGLRLGGALTCTRTISICTTVCQWPCLPATQTPSSVSLTRAIIPSPTRV